ncbi:hypothetical protein FBU59_005843 [Linderina macrospora]|uniref:Uncharacterized protein n=1 Tax=Linderina macrospora TaxID=4868 RepID=A0ACC1J1E9_9FUNG|nr:hypothetical protein FBU59_005843 [Linderina macrospora]
MTPRLAQIGGVVVPPSSKKADRSSNTAPLIRPSSPRADGSNARRLDNTLSMAAVGDAPWYKNPGPEVNESFNEFQLQQQQQQQQLQQERSKDIASPNHGSPGRNNRNSMQYFVGAPQELISQEQHMGIPDTVNEIDDDDDDSAFEDPMMRLSRHGSSQTLQSTNLPAHMQSR